MDCIFFFFFNGEIPSYTIYEDENVKAFLDISPVANGHTLIVPKKHIENIYDADVETLKNIELASKVVGKLLKEKLGCNGITRMQNNEYGQDVKHYHMHLVPRYKGDKLKVNFDKSNIKDAKESFEKIIGE